MSSLGNKEVMAKNIRWYLMSNEKTQKEICKDLGIKETTFSDWMNAKTYPRIDKVEKMANYFGIQKSDLIEDKSDIDQGQDYLPSCSYTHIPVGISAGKLEDCEGLSILPRMSVPDAMMGKYARDPHVVIMHVNGESMNRIIENGATIAVLTNIEKSQLRNGDIVVACTGPSYTVKRFYNDTGNRIIVLSPDSTDPEFGPITIPYDSPEELKIFGKVVMYSVIL